MKKTPFIITAVALIAVLGSCSNAGETTSLAALADGLEEEGTQLKLEGNNAYAFESISAVSMLPEIKDLAKATAKGAYVSLGRNKGTLGESSASATSEATTSETSETTAEDAALTTVKTFLPEVDAAMSNSSVLTYDDTQASDLTDYTNLIKVTYFDFSGATKTFSLYFNIVTDNTAETSSSETTSATAPSTSETSAATSGNALAGIAAGGTQTGGTQTSQTSATTETSQTSGTETSQTSATGTPSDPNTGVPAGGTQTGQPTGQPTDPNQGTPTGGSTAPDGHHGRGEDEEPIGPKDDDRHGYTPHFDDGKDEDGEKYKLVFTEIEGIVVADGTKYTMEGRTVETEDGKTEVHFGFYYDTDNYIKVRQLYSDDIEMFKYTVVSDDKVTYSYSLGLFKSDTKTSVTLKNSELGDKTMIRFSYTTLDGKNIIKATVKESGTPHETYFFQKDTDTAGVITYTLIDNPYAEKEEDTSVESSSAAA
jgi:hypothetical protein